MPNNAERMMKRCSISSFVILAAGLFAFIQTVSLLPPILLASVGWALSGPMKDSVLNISEVLTGYRERLQKPLIKMERQEGCESPNHRRRKDLKTQNLCVPV
jgi:hypothetical protein